MQSLRDLFGILAGIARERRRLRREPRGRLMVLTATGSVGPHGHEHVGPRHPDEAHVVADDLVLRPHFSNVSSTLNE